MNGAARRRASLILAAALVLAPSVTGCVGEGTPTPSASSATTPNGDGSPTATPAETGSQNSDWYRDRRAQVEALTRQWAGVEALAGMGHFGLKHGIGVSDPSPPIVTNAAGQTSTLRVGGGATLDPEGSGRYYLTLPMAVDTGSGTDVIQTECRGTTFAGEVAECAGWVVRATSANSDGSGSFEILAIPEGFELPEG